MALPPKRENEHFRDYIYRLTSTGRLDPSTADRMLAISRGEPMVLPESQRGTLEMPTDRQRRPQDVEMMESNFLATLTPEELAEISGTQPGVSQPLVARDQFVAPRGVRRPARPDLKPDLRTVDEALAAEAKTPLSIPSTGLPDKTQREREADNARVAVEGIQSAIRRLETLRGSMTDQQYDRRMSKLTARLERAEERRQRFSRAKDDPRTLAEDRVAALERAREREIRKEQVRNELAKRSIARRIRRGADPRQLIEAHNVGGAGRGINRYLDPAEFGYRRPQAAAAADGSIVDGDEGKRRVQTDSAGETVEIPVFETFNGEHIIDPSGISEEEFAEFYTQGDRQRTAEMIYATGSSLASRQRAIDSARNSASLDDYLNDEDRAAALQQIDSDEARLHRQFLMSNAALLTNRAIERGDEAGKDAAGRTMQSDLLEYINERREAAGEEPFETYQDAVNGLGPRAIREFDERFRQKQMEESTPVDLPPMPSANQGRGVSFFQRFVEEAARAANMSAGEWLGQYFNGSGNLTQTGFSELVPMLNAYLLNQVGMTMEEMQTYVGNDYETFVRVLTQMYSDASGA